MQKIVTCCRDCPNRHPGCHGECQTYKDQKAALADENENIRQRKENDQAISNTQYHNYRKIKRNETMKRKRAGK